MINRFHGGIFLSLGFPQCLKAFLGACHHVLMSEVLGNGRKKKFFFLENYIKLTKSIFTLFYYRLGIKRMALCSLHSVF